jgi:hypothetical protein
VKLSKERVAHLAASIVVRLHQEGYLELAGPKPSVIEAVRGVITDELLVEDRLNAEIRELMKRYDAEIRRGGADYQKMFTLLKSKLVKERGLIL